MKPMQGGETQRSVEVERDELQMPFVVRDADIQTPSGRESVMIVTPKNRIVVDRARLERLRKPSPLSRVEKWLIEQAAKRGAGGRVVLFRAVDDGGQRVWEFDPSFSDDELREGGTIMSRALLPFHRALLANGVVLMVHTDWGFRESYAFRHGVRILAERLDQPSGKDPYRPLDQWILKNMLLHVALKVDHVIDSLLPGQMSLLHRRWPRATELLRAMPAECELSPIAR